GGAGGPAVDPQEARRNLRGRGLTRTAGAGCPAGPGAGPMRQARHPDTRDGRTGARHDVSGAFFMGRAHAPARGVLLPRRPIAVTFRFSSLLNPETRMASIGSREYDKVVPQKVAFLGLGVMGLPMAGHLARAGHEVTVYNRTAAKAQAWAQE